MTVPASIASAQVRCLQHVPLLQISFVPHGLPQPTDMPHAFDAFPQVAVPQVGAAHDAHIPPEQCVPLGQVLHETVPLPQAFATLPHLKPASVFPHSGGGRLQTPSMHCCPPGQLQLIELPQTSATVPQRWVVDVGVHVSGAQVPGPASCAGWVTHALLMQTLPPVHPPQLIGTPQPSVPTMPQLFVHVLAWQVNEPAPALAQTCPPVQAVPHANRVPVQGSV